MARLSKNQTARIKRQASPAIERVMAPGDSIVAGVLAETGPSPLALAAAGIPLVVAGMAPAVYELIGPGTGLWDRYGSIPVMLIWLALLLQHLNRPVLLAVTDQQVICYRLTRYYRRPSQLLFAVPLAAVRVNRCRRGALQSSLNCEAPWPRGGASRRLWVRRPYRADLDKALTALSAAGAVTPG